MRSKNPLVQRYLGPLEQGPDRHRELVEAIVALIQAGAVSLALQGIDAIRGARPTLGADRAIRSPLPFQMLTRCVRVCVDRIV